MAYPSNDLRTALARLLSQAPPLKRKVFISYHHGNDQIYADHLKSIYSDQYDVFYDNSLDDEVDSDDPEYINRKIREDYINGSSITIVLCGAETHKRRFVDWEIYSSLHLEHALLGVVLPTAARTVDNKIYVPSRLSTNINTGYAHFMNWPGNADILKAGIENAMFRSKQTRLIDNSALKMTRNTP